MFFQEKYSTGHPRHYRNKQQNIMAQTFRRRLKSATQTSYKSEIRYEVCPLEAELTNCNLQIAKWSVRTPYIC
jgi:hypothetical protein